MEDRGDAEPPAPHGKSPQGTTFRLVAVRVKVMRQVEAGGAAGRVAAVTVAMGSLQVIVTSPGPQAAAAAGEVNAIPVNLRLVVDGADSDHGRLGALISKTEQNQPGPLKLMLLTAAAPEPFTVPWSVMALHPPPAAGGADMAIGPVRVKLESAGLTVSRWAAEAAPPKPSARTRAARETPTVLMIAPPGKAGAIMTLQSPALSDAQTGVFGGTVTDINVHFSGSVTFRAAVPYLLVKARFHGPLAE